MRYLRLQYTVLIEDDADDPGMEFVVADKAAHMRSRASFKETDV